MKIKNNNYFTKFSQTYGKIQKNKKEKGKSKCYN